METDVSNILNDLKALSDSADLIIHNSKHENEILDGWFNKIKETANAIVNGTYLKTDNGESSTFSSKIELPNLVVLIQGKQFTEPAHRISNLIAEVKKDHVRRSKRKSRKSRKSLRKIILEKKSGNRWEISNPELDLEENDKKSDQNNISVSEIKDLSTKEIQNKLLEPQFTTPNKNPNKKYLQELRSGLNIKQEEDEARCTTQNHVCQTASASTPVTRSKLKASGVAQIAKGKKNLKSASQCHPSYDSPMLLKNPASKKTSAMKSIISTKTPSSNDVTSTPNDQTIIIDSDDNEEPIKTSNGQTKRKSSLQHSSKGAKKSKKGDKSHANVPIRSKRLKREVSSAENQTSKRLKVAKNAANPVIPGKTSSSFVPQNTSLAEKRILREIQKKEVIISENTRKIKSQREMKIEESKKARELKMEKALQQRLKIEKEKEERLKTRTHSKQETLQLKESVLRKKWFKKELQQETENKCTDKKESIVCINNQSLTINKTLKLRSDKIVVPSPIQTPSKNLQKSDETTFSKKISNEEISTKNAVSTSIKTPVKPARSIAKNMNKVATSALTSQTSMKHDATISKETAEESKNNIENTKAVPVQNKDVFAKPTLNATFVGSPSVKSNNMKSPAAKKVEFKENLTKTPVSNPSVRPTSYAMTPSESSFVSYDVSEIKDDDDEDEEEEETNIKKPIPSWALGVSLRNTLLTQHYNPVDTTQLFGNYFETPDLVKIMGMQKKHYNKRTSSAIWASSPNRSIISGI